MEWMTGISAEVAFRLPRYMHEWRNIGLCTDRIDSLRAQHALHNAYAYFDKPEPKIIFFPSPFAALNSVIDLQFSGQNVLRCFNELYFEPYFQGMFKVHYLMRDRLRIGAKQIFWSAIHEKVIEVYRYLLLNTKHKDLQRQTLLLREKLSIFNVYGNYYSGKIELWSGAVDFCIENLGCGDRQQWQIIKDLILSCGWCFPFEEVVLVCGRPTKIHVDKEDNLHAKGEPALQYADGYSLYAEHGQFTNIPRSSPLPINIYQ